MCILYCKKLHEYRSRSVYKLCMHIKKVNLTANDSRNGHVYEVEVERQVPWKCVRKCRKKAETETKTEGLRVVVVVEGYIYIIHAYLSVVGSLSCMPRTYYIPRAWAEQNGGKWPWPQSVVSKIKWWTLRSKKKITCFSKLCEWNVESSDTTVSGRVVGASVSLTVDHGFDSQVGVISMT